jgi:hypothetical protein
MSYSARINWFIDIFGSLKETKLDDTILIFGTPRGGTTWFMELLENLADYRPIFEPLNMYWFPQVKKIGIGYRPYFPIENKQHEFREYLFKVFTGQINGLNPKYQLNPKSLHCRLFGKKIIVKFIRGNRLLPWIANNFQVRKIFHIIRHPCATIASQIESGIKGYYLPKESAVTKEMFLKEVLMVPFLRKDKKLIGKIKELKTEEEILAAIWSIDNYIPFIYPKPYPWHIVIYEKLLTDGEKELKNIFNTIGTDLPRKALKNLRKTSKTSINKSKLSDIDPQRQLSKWKKKLSNNQINKILKVINLFGFDFYNEELEPDYQSITNWNYNKKL